ncbi:hypothetical protein [Streptomyces sp. NBC_00151]|uniref:hypothetical protein n=1 Tax=Streptomyces sp. NBC_00151 TaxID=2975669 RepID=UPI002DDB1F48|nr:hypothetical protein [Streptomyces sp. NBC_00151]WRZ37984.1 hypothetical protein OG915_07900 [Streptomyces sp. NBC_00151]
MPKKRRASMRERLVPLGCIAAFISTGSDALLEPNKIVRALSIFCLVVTALAVGTVFGRLQERRKFDSQGPQGAAPAPDISA